MREIGKTIFYLSQVIPRYRIPFFLQVQEQLKSNLQLHLISGVRSIDERVVVANNCNFLEAVKLTRMPLGLYWIPHNFAQLLLCDYLIVENNPRNLNTWVLLAGRRMLRKQTAIWGHVQSRKKPHLLSRFLHGLLNLMSNKILIYTEKERESIHKLISKVSIIPNSLYPFDASHVTSVLNRTTLIYSGQLEEIKKIPQLINAFANSELHKSGITLSIIGNGSQYSVLKELVSHLRLEKFVFLHGYIDDYEILKEFYSRTLFALGPGYAGLNILQANWFGVPILVDENSPHSPEIYLSKYGGVLRANFGDSRNYSNSLKIAFCEVSEWSCNRREMLAKDVRNVHNIELMSRAFCESIEQALSL